MCRILISLRVLMIIWFSFSQALAYSYASPGSTSSVILIRSSETSGTEFSAYTKTESIKTYAQYQLEQKRRTPRPIEIQSLLKQAQIDFLSYEPERSKKNFRRITEHMHTFDWNEEERKIIFYSLFRLAQLEKDLPKRELFLKEALVFGMDLKIDLQVFPPPLVNNYLHLKKKSSFVSLDLKKLFPWHEIVLINGKAHSNKETITLPYGMYRVSAFSSSHEDRTQVLSLSHFALKTLKTTPLVKGSCQKPVFNKKSFLFSSDFTGHTVAKSDQVLPLENPNKVGVNHQGGTLNKNQIHILFPNFCVWNDLQQKITQIKKNVLPAHIIEGEQLEEPEKQSQWETEEWLLLGAVLLVVGVTTVIVLGEDKKTKEAKQPKPLVKIGF
ncbi:MAG: hypothetical protein OXM55_00185 [Bdellovibrionales bacterium]|nr:hypothetical protein [Bdellovibrionales bacterium]